MRNLKIKSKIPFNKETIAQLDNTELREVQGGVDTRTYGFSGCICPISGDTCYDCETEIC